MILMLVRHDVASMCGIHTFVEALTILMFNRSNFSGTCGICTFAKALTDRLRIRLFDRKFGVDLGRLIESCMSTRY